MLNCSKLIAQGQGLASVLLKRATTVELDWDVRQKSRFSATDSAARVLGVYLPRGTVVRGGDVLLAEDGSLIRVMAAPQPVLRITHCSAHGSPFDLVRAAYHLGNRHVPIELKPDHLQIEPDHVLADMLRGMHLIVTPQEQAFEPESGAYAAGGHAHAATGSHSHADEHAGHEHAGQSPEHHHHQDPAHSPAPVLRGKPVSIPVVGAAAPHAHVHGPGCGHDHGQGAHHSGHSH
jgi:urease accessory protein